jgi:YHS domain-containing protein
MMRFFFFRLIPLLFIFWLLRSVLRSILSGWSSEVTTKPRRSPPTVSPGGELKKDPVCGTCVSPEISLSKKMGGETIYFCSPACRDKYRAAS